MLSDVKENARLLAHCLVSQLLRSQASGSGRSTGGGLCVGLNAVLTGAGHMATGNSAPSHRARLKTMLAPHFLYSNWLSLFWQISNSSAENNS